MTLPIQRVTLVTLGTNNLEQAKAFYAAWGWERHSSSEDSIAFYQMNGAVLALFDKQELAADQGRPGAELGTGAMTLAQNCLDDAETDAVFASAIEAGATLLKKPEKVFWGGYSGYFADPDGHVWEIATNPFWPLAGDGSLTLPEGD